MILCKWKFTLPKKKKILIYDESNSDLLIRFFKKEDCEILHTRLEEINILVLLISILKFDKNKLSKKYDYQYIHYVKPKLIITFIDNRISYYKLKEKFKNIKIISIQNGLRTEIFELFKNVTEKDNLSVDYLFVMDENIKKCYSKFIKGNIVVSGSIKNNLIPIKKNNSGLKKLLFISQYINPSSLKLSLWRTKTSFEKHFNAENVLIPLLANYCKKHKIHFEICGNSKDNNEAFFYKSLIGEKNNNWSFHPKVDMKTTYEMLDKTSAVVFIDSTLGYEALSRGIPVAAFSIRGESYSNSDRHKYNFGLPMKYSDHGPFWTNHFDENTFNKILNFVLNISREDWKKVCTNYAKEISAYDEGNSKFKNILSSLELYN